MHIIVGAEIRVKDASRELQAWCSENLVLENPEYRDRKRRGLWIGSTPQYLWLYRVEGSDLILPTGTGKQIRKFMRPGDGAEVKLADNGILEYHGEVPLYDYQKTAVDAMRKQSCGILQSPCGSGKTQMGIALAASLSRRGLWITHTRDLLVQSYNRAGQYFPSETLGQITEGAVQIGSHITFATVQTLSRLDLEKYRHSWDVVIVDECHRLAGTPTKATMFYKVMGSLAARHKYGLSATVHRSDGLIASTFAVLGPVVCHIPDKAVEEKTMKVRVERKDTGVQMVQSCLDTDGTLVYAKLISFLAGDRERNRMIVSDLEQNREHYNLVLSDRLEHLKTLVGMLPENLKRESAMVDGSMTSKRARAERERVIEEMRAGKRHFLFASFSLAKEGLDIPRLDRLYMTTPKKDYSVVTQSIGRIARAAEGKAEPVCYDYVDDITFCVNQYKRRQAHYRKAGCVL